MTTPPDKLFREGLEHYNKPAPASAWERIESGLDSKRKRNPWMKIAAGLLLLVCTSFLIWQNEKTNFVVDAASKKSEAISSVGDTISPLATEESKVEIRETSDMSREAVVNRESSDVSREALSQSKTLVDNYTREYEKSKNPKTSSLQSTVLSLQSSVSTHKSNTSDDSHMVGMPEPDKTSSEPKAVSQVEITKEILIADAASDSKRTNITYTAEEVNAKYLKKESAAEATPEKKNTSGFQKVIDLALDFKNEGTVIGELREKKNEWLGFNPSSNKRETNK